MDRYRRLNSRVLPRGGPRPSRKPIPGTKTPAQSLVEFALITPLLFTLIFGIIEFGWLFNNHMMLHYATHEGARVGSVSGRYSDADDQVKAEVRNDTSALIYSEPMRLRIYKAGLDDLCVSPCYEDIYDWNGSSWDTISSAHPWPPASRSDVEPTDNLGVEIIYQHYFLTNFLPSAMGHIEIRDHSVIPVEPAFFSPPPP